MRDEFKLEIERGIQLLELCQQLQSEKDGVKRTGVIPVDQFALDISNAKANHSALYQLMPILNSLGELGRKLCDEGVIKVDFGDSQAEAALKYVLSQYGISS